jgi:ABC-2 type transport system permease protein
MRLFAEERSTGSIVLLYSAPIREYQIVLGKFLSGFLFLSLITLITVYMPVLIFVNGKVAIGHIIGGYIGLLLLGAASIAMGSLGSALAKNQIVAAVTAGALLGLMLIFWLLAKVVDKPLDDMLVYLSLYAKHFIPFMRGVVHTQSVIYYLSVTYFFLLTTIKVLEVRRWK